MGNVIGMDMIKKLMKGSEPPSRITQQDDKARWPGAENLHKLAERVDEKKSFVVFNNRRFSIKYYDDAVLVKPTTGGLAPMGWFSYRQLRDAINSVPE